MDLILKKSYTISMNTANNSYTVHMKELIRKSTLGNYCTTHDIIMKSYLKSHTQENVQ